MKADYSGAEMRSYDSLPSMFQARVEVTPDDLAYRFPGPGGWEGMTWRQTEKRVRAVACGLHSLGLADESRCAVLSATRMEWILADLGILAAGCATTTVYPTTTPQEYGYILNDSESQVIFAETSLNADQLLSHREDLPQVKLVVVLDNSADPDDTEDGWVIPLRELERLGKEWDEANPGEYEKRWKAVKPTQLATLIYTSGTTGMPKGVELTHDCWAAQGEAVTGLNLLTPEHHQYLWLPLSHVFGKVLQVMQYAIGFSTSVDGRVNLLLDNLAQEKPTFMAAAPRIFEKVHNKVITGARDGGKLKYGIFRWAMKTGLKVSKLRQQGEEPSGLLALQFKIAKKLVFNKLSAKFGGRLEYFVSGSAALNQDIAEFFHAADFLILEGYGLTESGAASFVNRPDKFKFGSVGIALDGVECKINPEDGEILLKGRSMMRGYHNLPKESAETIKDGWLHTGDIGRLDEEGFLYITDRKKDMIKTSNGKFIAPQMLEGKMKALCPYISQVVVHGNNRKFCSALITLDRENLIGWLSSRGLSALDGHALAKNETLRAEIKRSIDQMNATLPRHMTLKKFALLPEEFSIDNGMLTPSMKVKRKVVEERFRDTLNGFYRGDVAEHEF